MKNSDFGQVEKKPNVFTRLKATLQRRMVAGLVALIPLLVTIFVLVYLIDSANSFVRGILGGIPGVDWTEDPWVNVLNFPGIGVIVFLVIFFLMGILVATAGGRKLMQLKSTILRNTPVVGSIYGVTEQLTSSLTSQYNFSRVVLLEWPREGMLALGFVTGRAYNHDTNISLAVVYVPTVPNPTSGNMAFVNEDDVLETDMSVEEAMRLVFTGGLVMPEWVSLGRLPREKDPAIVDEYVGRFHMVSEGPE